MLQSKNCIRTGQILLDENRHSFILCNNCHSEFYDLNKYHKHLTQCSGLRKIFQNGIQVVYNRSQCEQLTVTNKCGQLLQQYMIYNWKDVKLMASPSRPNTNSAQVTTTKNVVNNINNNNNNNSNREENINCIDLINIEEELMDPRWYIDIPTTKESRDPRVANKSSFKRTLHYDELVEAVTPFVQFKENNMNSPLRLPASTSTSTATTATSVNTNVRSNNDRLSSLKRSIIKLNGDSTIEQQKLTNNNNNIRYRIPISKEKTDQIVLKKVIPTTTSSLTTAHKRIQPQLQQQSQQNKSTISTTSSDCLAIGSAIKRSRKEDIGTVSQNSIVCNQTNNPASNVVTATNSSTKCSGVGIIEKQTETAQILNKLQTLGLQIKRTSPESGKTLNVGSAGIRPDNAKILELLQKLQSKGMKVSVRRQGMTTSAVTEESRSGPHPGGGSASSDNSSPPMVFSATAGNSLTTVKSSNPHQIIPSSSTNITTLKNIIIRKVK